MRQPEILINKSFAINFAKSIFAHQYSIAQTIFTNYCICVYIHIYVYIYIYIYIYNIFIYVNLFIEIYNFYLFYIHTHQAYIRFI